MSQDEWILLASAALGVLAVAGVGYVVWRRRATPVERAINAVAVQKLRNVLLPNGMGGQIHLEYLLLTANGLVVVDVKPFAGTIFASDRMTEWTVMGGKRRFTFPNPQGTLYDRVAALRQLVRDVPVAGHVLFAADADFSKGKPRDVLLPAELATLYAKPDKAELERLLQILQPQWQNVLAASQPAPSVLRSAPR